MASPEITDRLTTTSPIQKARSLVPGSGGPFSSNGSSGDCDGAPTSPRLSLAGRRLRGRSKVAREPAQGDGKLVCDALQHSDMWCSPTRDRFHEAKRSH